MKALLTAIFAAIVLGPALTIGQAEAQAPDPFVGTFASAEDVFTLRAEGGGYVGTALSEGQTLQLQARRGSATQLVGNLLLGELPIAFEAQLQGNQLRVTVNGDAHVLTRRAPLHSAQPPVAQPPSAAAPAASPVAGTSATLPVGSGLAPGEVGDAQLGLGFRLPPGLRAERRERGFLIGGASDAALFAVFVHGHSNLTDLRTVSRQGVTEGGLQLRPEAEPSNFGSNGIAMTMSGLADGKPVRAYAVGLVSPLGGGITLLFVSATEELAQSSVQHLDGIARSARFFAPQAPPVTPAQVGLKQKLAGSRLTHFWRYSGGGSGEKTIDLCAQGHFKYSGTSSMSVSGGSVSAYTGGTTLGDGAWSITANGASSVLRLSFRNGNVVDYRLQQPDGKLLLNGDQYFISYDGERAPRCP